MPENYIGWSAEEIKRGERIITPLPDSTPGDRAGNQAGKTARPAHFSLTEGLLDVYITQIERSAEEESDSESQSE